MTSEKLQGVLQEIADDLPGFVAAAVIDNDGVPLAGVSELDLSVPAGMFTNAWLEIKKAFEYSEWGEPAEALFSSDEYLVVLSRIDASHYLGITVKSSANLGMVRAVRTKMLPDITEALKDITG